jgi:hypothetical protein
MDAHIGFEIVSDSALTYFTVDFPALVECFVAHVSEVVYAACVLRGLVKLPLSWVCGLFSCTILDEPFRFESEWGCLWIWLVGSFLVDVGAGGNATLQWIVESEFVGSTRVGVACVASHRVDDVVGINDEDEAIIRLGARTGGILCSRHGRPAHSFSPGFG